MAGRQRVLVVAAHPDDETLGAAALMAGARQCSIIHVTDGAPRDTQFIPAPLRADRGVYARIRRQEVMDALAMLGMGAANLECLGFADQDAAFHLVDLAHALAERIGAMVPDVVVTHAYEGAHPDHDAAAFAVWAAGVLLERRGLRAPQTLEMAVYHGGPGHITVGRFLDTGGRQELCRVLSDAELRRKHSMMRCFGSQQYFLEPFYAVRIERYRPAMTHDFVRPPHTGPLLYERFGFSIDGARWRSLATRARTQLAL